MSRLFVWVAVLFAATVASASDEGRIRFKDAGDVLQLQLKPKDEGYKLYGKGGTRLGKILVESGTITLTDREGAEIWKIEAKPDGVEVETPTGERVYKARRSQPGKDWQLVSAAGDTLYQFEYEENDGSYEVRNASGATLAKVVKRSEKLVFESEAGGRRFELDGVTDPRAGMFLAIDSLDYAQRAALMAFFLKMSP